MSDTLVRHLRIGICDDKCRTMEARSGCMCAEAADEIERLRELLRAARGLLQYHKAVYPDEIDEALDHEQICDK